MATPPPRSSPASLIRTLSRDVVQVFGEVRREGVRRTTARTLEDLDEFYLTSDRIQRLAKVGRIRRNFIRAFWLLESLFLRLTPTRRVLLVLAFFLLMQGEIRATFGRTNVGFDLSMFGVVLLLVILLLELKDKLLVRDEIEAARAVQQALFPDHQPEVAGWDVWLSTRPANEVGGDLVDHVGVGGGRTALVLADVAGKGLGAALVMARLQALVRAFVREDPSLAAFATRLNAAFRRDRPSNSFATMVCLVVEPESRDVMLVNAGHPPPILLRSNALETVPPGGPALGVLQDVQFQEQVVRLHARDALVVFSDGVSEAMNATRDFYGEERLASVLARGPYASAQSVAAAVIDDVTGFVGAAPWHDDLSLVVVMRKD